MKNTVLFIQLSTHILTNKKKEEIHFCPFFINFFPSLPFNFFFFYFRISVCPGNQISIGGNCYPFARLSETCVYSEQCIDKWIGSLRCINGICAIQMNDDATKCEQLTNNF